MSAILSRTGGQGLLWWRLRNTPVVAPRMPPELRTVHRRNALECSLHEHCLHDLIPLYRRAGIEPIILKGWSIARLYPHRGIRPCGDLDVCIGPGKLDHAKRTLQQLRHSHCCIDLHEGVADLSDRTWDQIVDHSQTVKLGEVDVRVLGWEDQLRQLCMHFARHGGWRPLWLCDIGLLLESMPVTFDWDYCLHGNVRRKHWLLCIVDLAQRLLDARPTVSPPVSLQAPHWLVSTVLHQWSSVTPGDSHTRDRQRIASSLARPLNLVRAVRCRWPNAIEAAYKMRAMPSNQLPKSLFQLSLTLRRGFSFIQRQQPSDDQSSAFLNVHVDDH